jgi:transcriptional regulator with XRE-family HTH domain
MENTNARLRIEFSQRLAGEMARLGLTLSSPTRIARAFNQQFSGQGVTAQTLRKWLLAEAMPTQPKLLALAAWFGVSAQWLRFGTGRREEVSDSAASLLLPGLIVGGKPHERVIPIVEMLLRLPARDLQLVKDIVGLMLATPQ